MFSTFKTIKVGGFKGGQALQFALEQSGCRLGEAASDLLNSPDFPVADEEAVVELVIASNADLGRAEGCQFHETCELALATGQVELCEPEDGPQLGLQFPDEPYGKSIVIAMTPRPDADGKLAVFSLMRSSRSLLYLEGVGAPPWAASTAGCRFVFRRRKQP